MTTETDDERRIHCSQPFCDAESARPFTDGWAMTDMETDHPHLLCPAHAELYEEFEALEVNEVIYVNEEFPFPFSVDDDQ